MPAGQSVPGADADLSQSARRLRAVRAEARPQLQRLGRASGAGEAAGAAPRIHSLAGAMPRAGNAALQAGCPAESRVPGGISPAVLSRLLCAASAGLALTGLAGWLLHAEILKTLLPGVPPMKVNTAAALLALSVAQWPVLKEQAAKSAWRRLCLGCDMAAIAMATATLSEYVFGLRLGIDEVIAADHLMPATAYPGRPAPVTLAAIGCIGAASILLTRRPRWCASAAHWLVAPAACMSLLSLIGYAYGLVQMPGPYFSLAFGTTLALCALAAAILLSRAAESWDSVLEERPAARAVFARLLPASFVLPPATGLLVLCGVRGGLYSPIFGFAIFAVMTVVGFIALSWETAWVAARVEGALQKSNAGLLAARLRAEEATRAKSIFLAGMSHELRTPLHAILGYAELLSTEGTLRTAQLARVMQMLTTGRHLLETINSVLAMSEIETGRVVLRPGPLDLRQLAADCIDLVWPAALAKGLEITVEAADDLPETIVADATRLRQIVVNLLGNAVKFTDRGSVTLRLRPAWAAKAEICIDVADTGRGIPPERRATLFQEFERLGVESEAHIEGAGLGLAIAARLAVMMGGRIDHADDPGGGSVFTLRVPANQEAPIQSAALLLPNLARVAGETATASPPRRVLIVDDVEINREIASAFLRSAGHAVAQAATGEAAVREAARQDFDVVLMDVRMGDIDGLEATRRIRALGGASAGVPIIAMTAHVFPDQIEACGRAGMDFHLPKPFDRAALLAAVETAIEWRDSLSDPDDMRQEQANRAGTAPVIDMVRFESMAAYVPADELARHLESLAGTLEALLQHVRADNLGAGIAASLLDQLHALAGKAGMMGFVRLASSAGVVDHLAHGGERVSELHYNTLLRDMADALAETRSRLAVAQGV